MLIHQANSSKQALTGCRDGGSLTYLTPAGPSYLYVRR